MHLPTWGREFNMYREAAYHDVDYIYVQHYVLARAMGFCERCGEPRPLSVVQVDSGADPSSFVALCSHCPRDETLRKKALWLEKNLSEKKLLYVTAAIIFNHSGKVLVCQRENLAWEFPGGKLDPGEDLYTCLYREIKEELDIEITNGKPFLAVDHDYGHVKLRLFSLQAELKEQKPQIQLKEHLAYRFVDVKDLQHIALAKADILIAQKLH